MRKLSVIIIVQNEEENIRACLESVRNAEEIIVVDAESMDRTREICQEYTNKIFVRSWQGFAPQKQFALDQVSHEWVLSLDADERVRPELWQEIAVLVKSDAACDGYRIARRSYFLGKWMRYGGWYPGYQLRLFRRNRTRVHFARVHEGFVVEGLLGTLKNDLDHFSHESLFDSLAKLNRYSSLEALDRLQRKPVHSIDFITHSLGAFLNKYIVQRAFLHGLHGFLLSWVSALVKMVLYMKIWHFQHLPESEQNRLQKELN
ncbi:glycosyltransferase family 2 protein [candidate division KSB1 bacterium]|nr:glycosyltransferase family 2 protein [candidate division KSB1 bacterium]